jgi:cellulose synthase/poly-beta-1,6-N-acetylglucosamine synthase-like glycosyltransferase
MKGPFSIWAFFGLTLWIDIITILIAKFYKKEKRINPYNPVREVSVIVPAYMEEKYIKETVEKIYLERYPIKNVVVCGDKYSSDMKEVVKSMQKEFSSLIYLECPEKSKAKKINHAIRTLGDALGEFIYVRDSRAIGEIDTIEKMVSYFTDDKVAAVTSYGRLFIPKNRLSRAYYYGKSWINEIGRIRKYAQERRNGIFVICGASTMYRKSILQRLPLLHNTRTEDTHYTWELQMRGFKVRVANDATISSPEIDGKWMSGITGQVRQSYRWSIGTMQCFYSEGRRIFKNKSLGYTTLVPGLVESVMYSIPLVLLPVLFFISYKFAFGFLVGDVIFSLLGTLILLPRKFLKTLIHFPEIMFFKYINSIIFLCAVIVTTKQAIFSEEFKWSNEWNPPKTRKIPVMTEYAKAR